MMKKAISSILCLLSMMIAHAQSFDFDMTKSQPAYSDEMGYGYDLNTRQSESRVANSPFYFSVKVPDGNYKVTVTLGSKKKAAQTVVRAESRRLFIEKTSTKKGKFETLSFVVNKRSPYINEKMSVRIKEREKDYLDWDDRLTLEFNGPAPAVNRIQIEPDTVATTLFLCGNSTVVDQHYEPWASWGQMIPRWFDNGVCISNHAESGLTASSFLAQNRLEKILSMMKPGDYVFCEFGHNDQKEKSPGSGAFYNFAFALKRFVDLVRQKGGHIVFVTPTQRRQFDESRIASG